MPEPKPRVFACPENGTVMRCKVCYRMTPHIRMELVKPTEPAPWCDTHRRAMVVLDA